MKILPLSIALTILTLSGLYLMSPHNAPVAPHTSDAHAEEILPVTPSLPSISTQAPNLTATSVYIYNPESETVLYQRNADLPILPASVTKMMTALIASEVYSHTMVVTVPPFVVEGQKMGLYKGEQMSIESLLYGTLVDSANDAAEVLARIYPGGRPAFIQRMNERALEIGMTKTVFKNPSGLDDPEHKSTAREMTLLGMEIMKDPALKQIVSTTRGSVSSADGKSTHRLLATNELLSTVPGVLGIKTGWTETAHENLVTYIVRDGHTIIISLFGSDDRFGETKQLIDWIFNNTQW